MITHPSRRKPDYANTYSVECFNQTITLILLFTVYLSAAMNAWFQAHGRERESSLHITRRPAAAASLRETCACTRKCAFNKCMLFNGGRSWLSLEAVHAISRRHMLCGEAVKRRRGPERMCQTLFTAFSISIIKTCSLILQLL